MSENRLGAMAADRRQKLLEIAAHEFASRGYENASLNRIIQACGMSKSSFYHFVDSKQALFDEVVRTAGNALRDHLAVPEPDAFAGPEFWDLVAGLGGRLASLSVPGSWYIDLGRMFYLDDVPIAPGSPLAEAQRAIGKWVAAVLSAGQASGEIRTDLPMPLLISLTLGILRTMDEWSLAQLPDLDGPARSDMTAMQLDVLKRLLSPT